jgi:glycosyltransferase involved in cell wall biosynthesis
VLHVVPHLGVGGADRVVLDLLGFDDPAVRRDLVVTEPAGNEWLRDAHATGARIWNLPELLPERYRAEFLLSLIADRSYDVVHIMNSRLGYDLTPAMARLDHPPFTVAHLHGEEVNGGGFPRYVASLHTAFISVFCPSSATLATRLRDYGVPADRIHVVHAGVDTALYRPRADGSRPERAEPVVLFPARLSAEKDPLLFVAVIMALRDRGVRLRARMLAGPLDSEVRAEISDAGLGDRITVVGVAPDMLTEYQAADVAVLTSQTEGIPLALLEAMSCALPVVAPDVGSVSEVVDASVGALVGTRSVQAFADALEPLLRDAALRRAAGAAARERVESAFSIEGGARHFHALYAELVTSRTGRPSP